MDALASTAEDGRGKTAKSPGELSSKPIRGYPNGKTRLGKTQALALRRGGTGGSETSQYPEEKKSPRFPK